MTVYSSCVLGVNPPCIHSSCVVGVYSWLSGTVLYLCTGRVVTVYASSVSLE